MKETLRFDHIVIGGGSAGCVAAAELCRRLPDARVLMLECGPSAEDHPETLRADGYKDAFINDAVIWDRFSAPQRHAGDQRIFMGSGGVLGGSASVNGMVYTRGAREDYDEWPEGWRWDDIDEDFRAIEARLRVRRREPTAWTRACISSAEACGFRHREDLNDGDLSDVIGHEWMNFEGEDRRSSYVAFIKDAPPENLTVWTETRACRLLFEARRARGVEVERQGERWTVEVSGEVLLAAGALETPKLLMLSGVGPSQNLRAAGVGVVADRSAIGQNLHDHPNVPVFFGAQREVDCFYPQLYSFFRTRAENPLPEGQSDSCYVFWPARSAMKQAVQRVLPGQVLPPSLFNTRAKSWLRGAVELAFQSQQVNAFVERLYAIVFILGKPKSRGSLRLRSADIHAQAVLDPRYLSAPEDMATMVAGVRKARELAASAGLSEWGSRELMPGKWIKSDEAIARWVAKNVITTYHYAGTCGMGPGDVQASDPRLKLRGVEGVRIADASAIPTTPVSALNAPSMLVGYRAARWVAEDHGGDAR